MSSSNKGQHKRQRRQVLAEDDYIRNLNAIIERDYFPELSELQVQLLLQQKREEGDYRGAIHLRGIAREFQEHQDNQRAHEAEQEGEARKLVSGDIARLVRKEPRPLDQESLTGFHSRVTSEDNAAFEKEQEREREKKRIERSELYKLLPSERDADYQPETPLRLAAEAFDASPHHPRFAKQNPENSLFFPPRQHSASSSDPDSTSRFICNSASENTETQTIEQTNTLMPPPSNRPPDQKNTVTSLDFRSNLVEYTPKYTQEKRIVPSATRFPSASLAAIRSAAAHQRHLEQNASDDDSLSLTTRTSGRYYTDSEVSTDLDDVGSVDTILERAKAQKRKRREHHRYVHPSPQALHKSSTEESQNKQDIPSIVQTTTPSFTVAEESSRERISHSLAKSVIARGKLSTPRTAPSLTPDSQNVFSRYHPLNRPGSALSRDSFGSALRSSYTPLRSSGKSTSRGSSSRSSSARGNFSSKPNLT